MLLRDLRSGLVGKVGSLGEGGGRVCGVFGPSMGGRSIISSFWGLFVVVVVLGKGMWSRRC